MRQWSLAVFRLVLWSTTLVVPSAAHEDPSAYAHAHTHTHEHGHEPGDSPFWAEGRIWMNYQEWSQSEEFKNNFPHYSCGTEEPTIEEMKSTNEVTKAWLKSHSCENPLISGRNPHCRYPSSSFLRQSANEPITIQVKWHSLMQDDGRGGATQQQIVDSVAALNAAYTHPSGGFRFQFDPATDLTLSYNSWWHFSDDIDDLQFKSVLREGGCTTLNIYSAASFAGIFGWGSKPFKCENGQCYNLCEAQTIDDGVVIRYDLVTGGPVKDFDEGDVLVHEVGHWLGLYHTFQGGDCSYPGDFIDDTPAERMPAFGCERVRDSCRGVDDLPSGLDPIHNYMNLSNDPCMFEFTDGQFAWMYAQWEAYRVAVDATEAPTTISPTTSEPTTNPPTTTAPTTSEPTTATPTTEEPTTTSPTTSSPTALEPTTSAPTTAEPTLDPTVPPVPATIPPAITLTPGPPTPGTIFTIPPILFPPDYLTLSPTTGPPSTTEASIVPTVPVVTTPPIREQKVAPDAKCGTVASQSGYGGAAAQAKGCVSRSNNNVGDRPHDGKKRRRIKGQ